MVEARLKADQFDINIPNEGVIVYRVQITDSSVEAQDATIPLALITKIALTAGQSITTDGAAIIIGAAVPGGGFSIQIVTVGAVPTTVPDVRELRHGVAGGKVIAAGLVPRFTGASTSPNAWVFHQTPSAGAIVSRGDTVTMLLRDTPIP